ncbi:unnamed protein product [Microthlaspi erraticum]|uniref:Uncharacterized protein n=1 Tax=Microthlaspi erraticum TaxID=1685480 RepID=A0A6D2IHY9_9BRAS|nr:unnamed protein product [Microthlaspi erraticum]
MKQFVAEVVTMGNLQHGNWVPRLGYCRRKGFKRQIHQGAIFIGSIIPIKRKSFASSATSLLTSVTPFNNLPPPKFMLCNNVCSVIKDAFSVYITTKSTIVDIVYSLVHIADLNDQEERDNLAAREIALAEQHEDPRIRMPRTIAPMMICER